MAGDALAIGHVSHLPGVAGEAERPGGVKFADSGCRMTVVAVAMRVHGTHVRRTDLASTVTACTVALLPVVLNMALLASRD